jgi:hypothetical protein
MISTTSRAMRSPNPFYLGSSVSSCSYRFVVKDSDPDWIYKNGEGNWMKWVPKRLNKKRTLLMDEISQRLKEEGIYFDLDYQTIINTMVFNNWDIEKAMSALVGKVERHRQYDIDNIDAFAI